jgi:hypothetical protein
LLIAFILLANKLFIWGFVALGIGLIIFGIQQLIGLNVKVSKFQDRIEGLEEKNKSLVNQNSKLEEEISYLKERQFQIAKIKNILELNLFEVDTHFNRPISRKETIEDDREIKYFGSLNISLGAKFGVDCKELRFKYIPDNDELLVANINPKFLSFGNRKLEWDFFEIYEFRAQNSFAEKRWMTTDNLYKYANKVKEDYRLNTEKSLEKGPEEFEWIYTPIKQDVINTIKVIFGGICRKITIVDAADESFVSIEKIRFEALPEIKEIQQVDQKSLERK